MPSLGWDIGGVNTKVALEVKGRIVDTRARALELQRAPETLVDVLRALAAEATGAALADHAALPLRHAVTMTAELSQMFRTKREGVAFVLDAVGAAFPGAAIEVYTVDGRFVAPDVARAEPLAVAAANWSATARAVARAHPDALLIDTGTTTTDIIPIVGGSVVATGWTDPDRLASGELVYTGAVRTPAEALASFVPLGQAICGVSAEAFALAGDVHVWRGDLPPAEYNCATPDGRPATRAFAGERLARVVCADREMLDERAITRIADALADAQQQRIVQAIERVRQRHPSLRVAIVTGVGAFLAARAARAAGLEVVELAGELGEPAARHAPAAAVALLLAEGANGADERAPAAGHAARAPGASEPGVDVVVKIGGGLLAHPAALDATLRAVAAAASERRLLVVPGGGPFADVVRDVDARAGLGDSVAHWMAVLAMDQYGHLLASRLPRAVLVRTAGEVAAALASGQVPVLAPSRWLQEVDPLPHTWDVTSDSIAAWVADALGAARLVMVKPPGARGDCSGSLVDAYFSRIASGARPTTVTVADSREAVAEALRR